MIPGPTPLSPGVRAALAAPLRGHATPENAAALARIRAALREVVGVSEAWDVYILPGSGTLAMETAVVNHMAAGDRAVVINHGFFADRFVEVCQVHGIEVDQVRAEWGRAVDPREVGAILRSGDRLDMVLITHVDTSTGTEADVPRLAEMARDAGAMVLLDGVCATAGVAEQLASWGVDLLVTCSQKALAAPPGLAVVIASPNARALRGRPDRRPGYYTDLARWDAPMAGPSYFATHATGLLRALDVSLEEILGEGLEARYRRHRDVASLARGGFVAQGFSLLTEDSALAPTLSVLAPPPGIDEAQLRDDMLEEGVLVAGGIGPFAGRAIRVGHMGSVAAEEVEMAIEAARRALQKQR
ncbi:MAG: alanine-glyoxylate transaminase / serine-glyoxylate transaminase / serine-pyruvate transaminase [Chloroflexota bacterium]|nr:alanine-glyoxylate transaminase / serine-glyoxylate transaminase / serine-pyruvate transaminase [Chloroflexota bacterium]